MLFQGFDENRVLCSLSCESQIESLALPLIHQIQNNAMPILSLSTIEVFNDNITIEIKSTNQSNILEQTIIRKQINNLRRERKTLCKKLRKFHSKLDKDNILRTIQVHFFTFIIKYINEVLYSFGIEEKFYPVSYKIKRDIKRSNFNDLKNKTIGKILSQIISKKFWKIYKKDKDINIKLYDKLIKDDNIKHFLSEKFINLFNNIYYQNKKEIKYADRNIYLSKDVKTFEDFMNNEKYNDKYRENIKKTVENNYLPSKIKFITKH